MAVAHDAIYDAIAAVIPSDVNVVKYFPSEADSYRKTIGVAGFDELEENWRSLGRNAKRQENYNVKVVIAYYDRNAKGNTGVSSVRDTVVDLYNYIRYAIHADKTLNDTVEQAVIVGGESQGVQPVQGGGYGMNMDVLIGVTARILSEIPS